MSILAVELGLPAEAFEDKHCLTEPCDSHCWMIRGPARITTDRPEIQTAGHTDFGTITLLFNWLGDFQCWSEPSRDIVLEIVESPQSTADSVAQWLWVKPKSGHAIVNLGDAVVKFSGGTFCSARHCVVPPPGVQSLFPCYSVVYFVRPEDACVLKQISGAKNLPLNHDEEEEELTASQQIQRQSKKFFPTAGIKSEAITSKMEA